MSKGFAASSRQILLASFVLASFVALGTRLVWLHVIDRGELLRIVAQVRGKIDKIPARRGDIVDARGAILATSRPLNVVSVDPQIVREEDKKKWPRLAELLGLPLPELTEKFNTKFHSAAPANTASPASPAAPSVGLVFNFNAPATRAADAVPAGDDDPATDDPPDEFGRRPIRFASLSDTVSESALVEIKALGVTGLVFERTYRRAYPHNALAAHVIGYVNRQEAPVTGIERYADFYLHGHNGWLESEKDGKRQELAQFRTREVAASDGYSVQLSIDSTVQQLVEDELAAIAEKYQPEKATIIVSDPQTGFILGMGNYPTFDLNKYNKLSQEERDRSMRNIAATDQYEPGSVFKIVAASGALEEGLVTPETVFDCALNTIDYRGKLINLPGEDHVFEDPRHVTLSHVVSFSSNRGAAQLGVMLGDDRFYKYVRAFGFGEITGFPGSRESSGTLAAPTDWDDLTLTRMPMGQSIAATPLQMHQAMGVIASGGFLIHPSVIRQIKDAAGEVVYRFVGRVPKRVLTERTARTMAAMLMGVASKEGTAPLAAIENYQVAGKTGTAQKLIPVTDSRGNTKLEYSHKNHVVSFVGFLPASNPQIAVSVIIDDADARCPGGVAYGSKVAAPVFKHLAQQLIQYREIKPVYENAPVPASSAPLLAFQGGHR
jgi:cell division protein FtsI (penicillin-binding protein 3)